VSEVEILLLGISVFMAVNNALRYVSAGAIPKINAPATGEEILMQITNYAGENPRARGRILIVTRAARTRASCRATHCSRSAHCVRHAGSRT